MYSEQFAKAENFTRSLGFQILPVPIVSGDLVTQITCQNLMARLIAAGVTSLVGSAFQCLKCSYALLPLVEDALGCKITLTAGSVHFEDSAIFDPSHDDFLRWRNLGVTTRDFVETKGLNFHVWYTLPNFQVLDLTLWSSVAVVWKRPLLAGRVDGGWPDKMSPYPRFVPMVLGTGYWEYVEARSEVPLLSE